MSAVSIIWAFEKCPNNAGGPPLGDVYGGHVEQREKWAQRQSERGGGAAQEFQVKALAETVTK